MSHDSASDLPPFDYVSPGFVVVRPDHAFPNMIVGDTTVPRWRWLRRWVEHNWYTDQRKPDVGFASRDEVSILYNAALLIKGRPCLEIGCWRGWSTVHLALGCGAADGGGTLDVIDPIFADEDFATGVRHACEAAGVADRVTLHNGTSPDLVEALAAETGRKWSLIFIDGDHEGDASRKDAETVMRYAADTALVLFHDLSSPYVAAGLDAMRDAGWHTMLYQTMQIMGVAWRGDIEPPRHIPDPRVFWTLPAHLAGYPVSGWVRPRLPAEGGWWDGMTMSDRRDAAMMRAQAAEDYGITLLSQQARYEGALAASHEAAQGMAKEAEALNASLASAHTNGTFLACEAESARTEVRLLAERSTRLAAEAESARTEARLLAERSTRLEAEAESARTEARSLTEQLAAMQRSTGATIMSLSHLAAMSLQMVDCTLSTTQAGAETPQIERLAHWLTGRRVLLGLLRRHAHDRLASVRASAAAVGLTVPETALHHILRRRLLLGLLRRGRDHSQRIIVLGLLAAFRHQRQHDIEQMRAALKPSGVPIWDNMDGLTVDGITQHIEGLRSHFDAIGRENHGTPQSDAPPILLAPPVLVHPKAAPPVLDGVDRPVAVIIDQIWPQPDRDAGSVETVNIVDALIVMGYRVIVAAIYDLPGSQGDRDRLRAMGATCLDLPANGPSLQSFIEDWGKSVAVFVLVRYNAGGTFLELIRHNAPAAKIVFHTIDLHFLREERQARLFGSSDEAFELASQTRDREEFLVHEADATIVVSSFEQKLLTAAVPGAYVVELPLSRPHRALPPPFEGRSGIGFVGGFAHAPNVDAVSHFLSEIWPLIVQKIPDCRFTIVGTGLPETALAGTIGQVDYLGYVEDLDPWFDSLRLTVAPLRFGAGTKGKVVSSLAAGVPCVGSVSAVEGTALEAGVDILVANTPQDFAADVVRLYRDRELWQHLSTNGIAAIQDGHSIDAFRYRIHEMMIHIGLPCITPPG